MKTLSALVERDSFDVPAFALDRFQRAVRENLHLEFFLARGRLIVTPHLSPTSPPTSRVRPRRRASSPSSTRSRTSSSS
jgi:hypothetical protein